MEPFGVLERRQLVVGRSRNYTALEFGDRFGIQRRPYRTRRIHVASCLIGRVGLERLRAPQLFGQCLRPAGVDVAEAEIGTGIFQHAGQRRSDITHSLDVHDLTAESVTAESDPHGRTHAG